MNKKKRSFVRNLHLSQLFTVSVFLIVIAVVSISYLSFINIYKNATKENVITNSERTVSQVKNTVNNYIQDIEDSMRIIQENIGRKEKEREDFFETFLKIRKDIAAITVYDEEGTMLHAWSDGKKLKDPIFQNLSYENQKDVNPNGLHVSKPHVESIFENDYPWVVTISQYIKRENGEEIQVAMDVLFSNVAKYVDGVGIGQHGYCYIADEQGNIIYHPQQQLIYAGLEKTSYESPAEGTKIQSNIIYSASAVDNFGWKIVGVCYVDEMITAKVEMLARELLVISFIVLLITIFVGWMFSNLFSKPVLKLTKAMREFEKDTDTFSFEPIEGIAEITSLTESFHHMVIRIQRLVEKVRQEEISLRKTELKALQAQINPHFLYNTLDAIAWCCEEERFKDAVEMVNALAKLFRISISRGHELITIEKEMQHAESYLKIQNFRYKNQFVYKFDVDETCLSYLCNKITLQPIIENAIYHGIDRMVDEGIIKIGIHQSEDQILFTIEDNGVGMTEEQCHEILYQETSDKVGIGIKNVNDRIKIYFGDKYGIAIESELDEGTKVTITMPKITEKDYVEK